jgi:hypothetical protein
MVRLGVFISQWSAARMKSGAFISLIFLSAVLQRLPRHFRSIYRTIELFPVRLSLLREMHTEIEIALFKPKQRYQLRGKSWLAVAMKHWSSFLQALLNRKPESGPMMTTFSHF